MNQYRKLYQPIFEETAKKFSHLLMSEKIVIGIKVNPKSKVGLAFLSNYDLTSDTMTIFKDYLAYLEQNIRSQYPMRFFINAHSPCEAVVNVETPQWSTEGFCKKIQAGEPVASVAKNFKHPRDEEAYTLWQDIVNTKALTFEGWFDKNLRKYSK